MFYFKISLLIPMIFLMIFLMITWKPNLFSNEKSSGFECGFDPLSMSRTPFSTRFFVLVVLFLIFDIEVTLLFPILNSTFFFLNLNLLLTLTVFMILLILGLFYEWYMGALDWVTLS